MKMLYESYEIPVSPWSPLSPPETAKLPLPKEGTDNPSQPSLKLKGEIKRGWGSYSSPIVAKWGRVYDLQRELFKQMSI
jgi:hypothetical protein